MASLGGAAFLSEPQLDADPLVATSGEALVSTAEADSTEALAFTVAAGSMVADTGSPRR
ncbi:MAG: hypothetical protein WBD87_07350 [Candidatus Acidiferrales bacterium]